MSKTISKDVLEYIKKHGFALEDLTDDELQQVVEEVEMIKENGPCFLDSVLDSKQRYK